MQVIPLAEWLYEEGIGENRAALIDKGIITKIRIERNFGPFIGPRFGDIKEAKLLKKHKSGGFILLNSDEEAVLKKWPAGYSEGQSLFVQIVRERIWERTRVKPAIAEYIDGNTPQNAPSLRDNINSSNITVKTCLPYQGDTLSDHGWYEACEQAERGLYDFANGSLIIDQSAAMTMIDVDGDDDAVILSQQAAKACADVITLFDLQGMVGIDFPTIEKKEERHKVATIFDQSMERPCERTAINGFGFMQIVMKNKWPSLLAILGHDKILNVALDILRRAELTCNHPETVSGEMSIIAHPHIIAALRQYDWLNQLSQRTGRNWTLIEDEQYSIDNNIITPAKNIA